MMVQIPAVIRQATRNELFGVNDIPVENAVYFLKSKKEDPHSGPYTVHSEIDQADFINWYIFRKLYVLITEGDGFCFLMNLRIAKASDLLQGKYFRVNYIYYIKESVDTFDGPHFLKNESDSILLASLVRTKSIYVIAEEQTFTPYNLEKSA